MTWTPDSEFRTPQPPSAWWTAESDAQEGEAGSGISPVLSKLLYRWKGGTWNYSGVLAMSTHLRGEADPGTTEEEEEGKNPCIFKEA